MRTRDVSHNTFQILSFYGNYYIRVIIIIMAIIKLNASKMISFHCTFFDVLYLYVPEYFSLFRIGLIQLLIQTDHDVTNLKMLEYPIFGLSKIKKNNKNSYQLLFIEHF